MKMSDATFRHERKQKFPYLHVSKLDDDLAFLITSIPKGDLPVVTTKEGRLRQFASVTTDPFHLMLFIKLYNPVLVISLVDKIELITVRDYVNRGVDICQI